MARCTAPKRGHRTASARAACPACGGRGYYRGYNSYGSSYPRISSSTSSNTGGGSRSRRNRTVRASWSPSGSTILYTPYEVQTLTPVRKNIEERSSIPDIRDVFLCHAWDDRRGVAQELCDLLESQGVSVWFSEKDISLGASFLREIDRGLTRSKIGIVLVTPSFLERIKNEGIADKELSVLLARDLLIPIIHETTYNTLRDVSPLLGSRNGLDTATDSMQDISARIADLVNMVEA